MPIREEDRGRSCDWCGIVFVPYRGRRDVRWCSSRCKSRAGSARPRSVEKFCGYCGGAFLPVKSAKQKYCRPACGAAAKNAAVRADPVRLSQRHAREKAYSRSAIYRANQQRNRALRRAVIAVGNLTLLQWAEIIVRFDGRCAYCGEEATTQDHVVPIRAGGQHSADNVVPCCRRCNSTKGQQDWSDRLAYSA